ncbi:MAG TPA: matrixin family metalloprotease, partial [Polyangiaceae bacterium]|nr:matrixin family metalloprotease [Polyangiaceae bacterium]
ECGHFLGLAHTGDDRATMYASYTEGTTYKRILTSDDVSGLCSIYLAGGERAVDPSATPDGSGLVAEDSCDPTPRHGFSTQCAPPKSKSCDVTGGVAAGLRGGASTWSLLGCVLAVPLLRRRRARSSRSS